MAIHWCIAAWALLGQNFLGRNLCIIICISMSTLIPSLISTLKQGIVDGDPKFWVSLNYGCLLRYDCVCSTQTKLSDQDICITICIYMSNPIPTLITILKQAIFDEDPKFLV